MKNLHIHPLGCKKCLWRDSRAYFSDPRPRPFVPMSLKLLHDLGLLGQASLKLQGHLHFVNKDHFCSFFTTLIQESPPYIRKTTLFSTKIMIFDPILPLQIHLRDLPWGHRSEPFWPTCLSKMLLKYNTFAFGTQKCVPGDHGGDIFV